MSSEAVILGEGCVQALKEIHADGDDAFLVLGYSDKVTLTVTAQGEGSVDEAAKFFKDDDASYVLIRKNHKVEMIKTVKFAFVAWVPETAKPMRKSMLSIHKGQVKDLFLPFHVFLDCADAADLKSAEAQIMDKIGFSSGTKLHVTQKEVYKAATNISSSGGVNFAKNTKSNLVSNEVRTSQELDFEDRESFDTALKAVKSDSDDTNWLLMGYAKTESGDVDIKKLALLGSGSGGIAELRSKLDDTRVYYAYFRLTEQYDKSVTTKFCYLKLMTNNVRPLLRSKMTTHTGFIKEILSPVHVDFDLGDANEFSEEIVRGKIGGYTGTKSHVTAENESKLVREAQARSWGRSGSKSITGATDVLDDKDSNKLQFVDKDAFDGALAEVRADGHDNTWMWASYEAKFTLGKLSLGSGGYEEFMAGLDDSKPCFGLYRTSDVYDGNTTVKFVFVKFQPANIRPMLRGEVGTLAMFINPCFQPNHVDFFIESKDELSEEKLMAKVRAASGSAVFHS